MTKIIVPGKIPESPTSIRRFKCNYYGCVFEADKDEYECGSQYNEFYYSCKCPCCGRYANEERMRKG